MENLFSVLIFVYFVPVIGQLIAAVLYKYSLIKPYSQYIPKQYHRLIFWGCRICRHFLWSQSIVLGFILSCVKWFSVDFSGLLSENLNRGFALGMMILVYVMGSLAIPVLCLIEWYAYHRIFLSLKLGHKYIPIEREFFNRLKNKLMLPFRREAGIR